MPEAVPSLPQVIGVLRGPGLVVVAGPPGAGRSTLARRLAAHAGGPVYAGGGLATVRDVPGLALNRAVRARVPAQDTALAVEAVRARLRGGLLLLDDLQWADPLTLAVVGPLAVHCRVLVTVRTPHGLAAGVVDRLRAAAAVWLPVPPLTREASTALVRRVAPALGPARVRAVVDRAGGTPLALRVLAGVAQRAAVAATGAGDGVGGVDAVSAVDEAGGADAGSGRDGSADTDVAGGDPSATLDHLVAGALAACSQPARTALAALGLLRRPAPSSLLGGGGVAELVEAGLARADDPAGPGPGPVVTPTPPYVAEVAARLLTGTERRALHRRLAELLLAGPDHRRGEAARHLAAAGDGVAALPHALAAARAATGAGERAGHLLFAAGLADAAAHDGSVPPVDDAVRLEAGHAALAAGRPVAALGVLEHCRPAAPVGRLALAVLRAEAYLQVGDARRALATARAATDDAAAAPVRTAGDVPGPAAALAAEHRRVLLLAALAVDPALARALAAAGPPPPGDASAANRTPGAAAGAIAAIAAAGRDPGWEVGLAAAADAARVAGRTADEWWSRWLLVEHLSTDGRSAEAAAGAAAAADRAGTEGAYSWRTRFLAVELWNRALRGADLDAVVRRAVDLLDRTVPPQARAYLLAAGCLALADTGTLAPARRRLDDDRRRGVVPAAGGGRGTGAAVLDWVDHEVAWLDGEPSRALVGGPGAGPGGAPVHALPEGLLRVTARWAYHDLATPPDDDRVAAGPPGTLTGPAARTLEAWRESTDGRPAGEAFTAAANGWTDLAVRERVRCLLAAGVTAADPRAAVPPLLAAETLAGDAGLVVLLGRVHRALRRHAVRRDGGAPDGSAPDRGAPDGGAPGDATGAAPQRAPGRGSVRPAELTAREREVMALVAEGEPTRRIAHRLGLSRETVETHVRAAMRRLGARTRTEAATLAATLAANRGASPAANRVPRTVPAVPVPAAPAAPVPPARTSAASGESR